MSKCHAIKEYGLAKLFLQMHQVYFRSSYQLQSRGMNVVLHYRLYMCKQFPNPAGFIKNINHKSQYLSQCHRIKVCMVIHYLPQQTSSHQMQLTSNLIVDMNSLQNLYLVSKRLMCEVNKLVS